MATSPRLASCTPPQAQPVVWRGCPVSASSSRASACSAACSSPASSSAAIFLLTAIFAPLLAPYGFDQLQRRERAVRRAAAAVGRAPAGHDGRRLRRAVPGDLGLADRDPASSSSPCCCRSSPGAARAGVRLLRRLAGPRAGRRLRRHLRVPVAAARHRHVDRHHAAASRACAAASSPRRSRSPWSSSRSTSGWSAPRWCGSRPRRSSSRRR